MRDFRKFDIWIKGMEIAKQVYALSANLPKEEKYGMSSQIQRAAVSIPSNIAEGASRTSELDFKRFLEVGQGSAFELETQLLIIKEIGYIPDYDQFTELILEVHSIQKMLNAFISKIKLSVNS